MAVERFSLSQQPDKFTNDAAVLGAINAGGTAALPIVMVDGQIVAERRYPTREQLAAKLGLVVTTPLQMSKSGGCGCGPGKCG